MLRWTPRCGYAGSGSMGRRTAASSPWTSRSYIRLLPTRKIKTKFFILVLTLMWILHKYVSSWLGWSKKKLLNLCGFVAASSDFIQGDKDGWKWAFPCCRCSSTTTACWRRRASTPPTTAPPQSSWSSQTLSRSNPTKGGFFYQCWSWMFSFCFRYDITTELTGGPTLYGRNAQKVNIANFSFIILYLVSWKVVSSTGASGSTFDVTFFTSPLGSAINIFIL